MMNLIQGIIIGFVIGYCCGLQTKPSVPYRPAYEWPSSSMGAIGQTGPNVPYCWPNTGAIVQPETSGPGPVGVYGAQK
jgi:hypothetical protein